MKNTLKLVVFLTMYCFIISCNKQSCLTKQIMLEFSSDSISIPDTAVNFVLYRKGSSFMDSINSINKPLSRISNTHKIISLPISDEVYSYDWQIILMPSGKAYSLSNLAHGNSSRNTGMGVVKDFCVNSIAYTFNGSEYHKNEIFVDREPAFEYIYVKYTP